jgi:hypothetical protein
LNGKPLKPDLVKGYASIRRTWTNGDVLKLSLPLEIVKLEANPQVLQSRGEVTLQRGPLIYCLEQSDNQGDIERIALPAGAKLTAHFEPELLGGITTISGEGRLLEQDSWANQLYRPLHTLDGQAVPIKAIPYCVWGNRGQQKMKVWIRTSAP